MAGRPRQNRDTIKGTHLSIRLTDKEAATLGALVSRADAHKAERHTHELKVWEQRSTAAKLIRAEPTPPKATTYADIVRALVQQEAQIPRLYSKGFWAELRDDTAPLDRLVDLANDKESPSNRWTRETMMRKLIEDEFGRRRLKKRG